MVKQYKDGYFLNGKWFNGYYDYDARPQPHIKPINATLDSLSIKNGQLVALTDDGCVEPVYLPDNAWSNGNYGEIEEPYDTKYITYLFYGIIVILVLAILFVLASF